jgi:ABC-type multidrug transport system ATPase subunit
MLACSLPPDVFADYEYAEIGVGWDNYAEGAYSLQTSFLFMAMDSFAYLVLAAYIDMVAPTQHGSPRHPLFFLAPFGPSLLALVTYLGFGSSAYAQWLRDKIDPPSTRGFASAETSPFAAEHRDEEDVSWVDMGAPSVRVTDLIKDYHPTNGTVGKAITLVAMRIRSLSCWMLGRTPGATGAATKTNRKPMRAVDGLSIDLWAGQVTCLLGHNGAGKSTTVSMLTGLTPPTSGDCIIMGHSIVQDLASVRRTIGVCPQNNVVFSSLTVSEHLMFFAKVKGLVSPQRRALAVDAVISDVGLTEKRHVAAQSLSGGQKRKLCLAMALIGDPAVVFLDEPTSGMDPYSRRATWELIRRSKQGRVVVLTTHFMDEVSRGAQHMRSFAFKCNLIFLKPGPPCSRLHTSCPLRYPFLQADVLGDRVAIMSHGKLRCVGSPLWLKARFGVGYLLTITTTERGAVAEGDRGENVREGIMRLVPAAEFISEVARDLSFRLPRSSAPDFPALLDALEANARVEAFGLSVTTLEEVFIRIAEEDARGGATGGNEEVGSVVGELEARPAKGLDTARGAGGGGEDTQMYSQVGHEMKSMEATVVGSAVSSMPSAVVEPPTDEELDSGVGARQLSIGEEVVVHIWKRLVIFRRDSKGAFFQMVLPIVLVAAILAILTIEVAVSFLCESMLCAMC